MATTTAANQLAPVDQALLDVRKMLAANSKGLNALLGSYMPPERYCGAIMTLCRHNPDLLDQSKASRPSLLLSVLRIAQLQLSPDPALGQAWIIPRKGRAEFQLGWKGCLALAYRHPLVKAVRYNVVGKNDRFVWEDGRDWRLEHEPSPEGWPENLNDVVAAWAIIELRTGGAIPRVMYLPEVLRHKGRGQGSQPAWATDPAAMALKTVIGDACRRGPFEGEIGRGFQLDHLGEVGKGQPDDGTIDADFSVDGAGTENPKGNLARFKAAHRVQQDPPGAESQGLEPLDDPAEVSDSGEVLPSQEEGVIHQGGDGPFPLTSQGSSDAAPEVAPEPPGPAPRRLAKEARARIYQRAGERGIDSVELERIVGKPLDQTDMDELAILGKIKNWKPAGKVKRS